MRDYDAEMFRKRVKAAMDDFGLDIVGLSRLTGLSYTNLHNIIMRGITTKQGPSAWTLVRLAEALDCSLDWLLGVE